MFLFWRDLAFFVRREVLLGMLDLGQWVNKLNLDCDQLCL